MSDFTAGNGHTVLYRIDRAERDIRILYDEKATKVEVVALSKSVDRNTEKVEGMVKALYISSLLVATSAVGVVFAVVQSGG
jgi:hypothetical protein